MVGIGGNGKEFIRPDFNRSILIGFQGAQFSLDTGFLLFREMDKRFHVPGPLRDELEDPRSQGHRKHTQ